VKRNVEECGVTGSGASLTGRLRQVEGWKLLDAYLLRRRRAQALAPRDQKVTHAHKPRTQRVHAFICPYGAGLRVPVSLVMENTRTLFVSCRSEAVLFT